MDQILDSKQTYRTFSVTLASPHIGAEITDIDLTKPLNDGQIDELHQAFVEFQVLFFRDQKIGFDDIVRAAGYFGPLVKLGEDVDESTVSKSTDNPFIRKFHYDETSTRVAGGNYHTDTSNLAVPPLASMLYNHTVPPHGGGDTIFASMCAAYDGLSDKMKNYLAGLTATHDGARVYGPGTPKSSHPVIVKHPDTGRKAIFVNKTFTTRINGVPRLESDRILEFLYEHCQRPEWSVRFRWRAHSIAFWDNRCTQHKAIWDYWPNVRSGFRVQVEGTVAPIAG